MKIEWCRSMVMSFGGRRIDVFPDGAGRIDEVVPGTYKMVAQIYDPRDPSSMVNQRFRAKHERSLDVPAATPNPRASLNLGAVEIALAP